MTCTAWCIYKSQPFCHWPLWFGQADDITHHVTWHINCAKHNPTIIVLIICNACKRGTQSHTATVKTPVCTSTSCSAQINVCLELLIPRHPRQQYIWNWWRSLCSVIVLAPVHKVISVCIPQWQLLSSPTLWLQCGMPPKPQPKMDFAPRRSSLLGCHPQVSSTTNAACDVIGRSFSVVMHLSNRASRVTHPVVLIWLWFAENRGEIDNRPGCECCIY